MSPPLVVAFAIAGKIDIDMDNDPVGFDEEGKPVFLREIWPSSEEIQEVMSAVSPDMFRERYSHKHIFEDNPVWETIVTSKETKYSWDSKSTYIQPPPYFDGFTTEVPPEKTFVGMRPLALFGDSVTTDHISPAGAFSKDTSAGKYLLSKGVQEKDFNSYGSRRGNHNVMMRGTFANVRIRNLLAEGTEGGVTKLMPEGTVMPVFDACQTYAERKVPLIIFAGKDYGMGSSRDWAAKGTALLGVRAVVAQSFERIHRSNLIGMGVLPLQLQNGESYESLEITGNETFTLRGLEKGLKPGQEVILEIDRGDRKDQTTVISRIDTSTEVDYFQHGGIMPYVLRFLLGS